MSGARSSTIVLAILGGIGGALAGAACVGDDPSTPLASDGGAAAAAPPPPSGDASLQATPADAGKDGSARYCAGRSAVLGVADFFCADFDGAELTEGFTDAAVPEGAALLRVNDVYTSAPAAFASRGGGAIEWRAVGGTPFSEVDARVKIHPSRLGGAHPDTTGSIRLLRLEGANSARIGLHYTRGGAAQDDPYRGYYITAETCVPGCAMVYRQLSAAPAEDAWTEVRIVWTKDGRLSVELNGLLLLDEKFLFGVTSTWLAVWLGAVLVDEAPTVGRYAFDDLQVAIKR